MAREPTNTIYLNRHSDRDQTGGRGSDRRER